MKMRRFFGIRAGLISCLKMADISSMIELPDGAAAMRSDVATCGPRENSQLRNGASMPSVSRESFAGRSSCLADVRKRHFQGISRHLAPSGGRHAAPAFADGLVDQ